MAIWRTTRTSGPSSADIAKLAGVVAALREVQRHVRAYKYDAQINGSHLNDVLDLLPRIADHDWQSLRIGSHLHWQADFLMRTEAAIAFLSALMDSWEAQSLRTPIDGGKLETVDGQSPADKPAKRRGRALSLIKGKST